MPVFKIKKDGVWQEVAGVSGHSHSVSEIVDFPSMDGLATEDYVDSKLKNIVDATLSVSTQAADAKAVGDALSELQVYVDNTAEQKSQVQIVIWEADD